MADGIDDMSIGFDAMANTYVAGGEPVRGMGANSLCGTVEGVVAPMWLALEHMESALAMLNDQDGRNDPVGGAQFHAGKGAMAEHLGDVLDVMRCMGRPMGGHGTR